MSKSAILILTQNTVERKIYLKTRCIFYLETLMPALNILLLFCIKGITILTLLAR